MAISRGDFWSFIIELVTRNPTMGIPALADGLFANLLISDYLYMCFVIFVKVMEGKGKEKGKGREKGEKGRGGKGKKERQQRI